MGIFFQKLWNGREMETILLAWKGESSGDDKEYIEEEFGVGWETVKVNEGDYQKGMANNFMPGKDKRTKWKDKKAGW